MRRVYQTDETRENFFTTVFYAYNDETAYLTSAKVFQNRLDDIFVRIETESDKAERVRKKLASIAPLSLREIDKILRSCNPEKAQIAFEYLKLVVKHGKNARERLTIPAVRQAMDEVARVGYEVHRLHGFLRFQECESGIYYGACAPDNDILELLAPHFVARFKTQPFVIHDIKRNKAVLYNGEKRIVVPFCNPTFSVSDREKQICFLWKKYYHDVAIPERKNLRQMKNYMPVRYWKFMSEKDGDDVC